MAKFSYKAINDRGRPVRGVINAANESDLFSRLQEAGMSLVDCKELTEKANKMSMVFQKKIKMRDQIQLFVQLEQLQNAGVPLLDSLSDVRESTETARLRDIMGDIYNEVSSGSSFSAALAQHMGVFAPITISLISAGEETGNLTESFSQVIRNLKWSDAMDTKVKKATRYPKVLGVVVIGVIWLMMGHVVPEVVGFLKNIGQELPPITVALIATSNFFANYTLYLVGAGVVFWFILKVMRVMSNDFKYHTDAVMLRMPVMGPLIRKISLSRFCQTFAVLFTSGLEILKCLEAAKQTCTNLVLVEAMETVKERVQEGSTIAAALERSGEFPSLVVRMVRIGEESGNLSGVLEQVAEFYDKDVNEAVEAMIQMIEPTMTAILGGMLLWIAAAVFGPVYDSFAKMGDM